VSVIGAVSSETHKEVLNVLHAHIQPIAVRDVNIHCSQELILRNKQSSVFEIAPNIGISVETIIHEYLLFTEVCD
jgi:hypothetical protein